MIKVLLRVPAAVVAMLAVAMLAACGGGEQKKIVLIGGTPSEGAARHAYPDGVRLLESFLRSAPEARGAKIEAFADGWPDDPAAFDGASTLVLYFDGQDKHPLLDAGHRRQFEELMRRGVGLVALHQASTVPVDDTAIGLQRWLGGARFGTFDRSTETVEVQVADPSHPSSHGVRGFRYRDEFYPTLRFAKTGVTPILTGTLHVQYRDGASVVEDLPEKTTLAWAYERAQGGRSFGFTGAHYLAALDQPMLRRSLLNAILWTAHIEVPREGATLSSPAAATRVAEQAMAAAPPADDSHVAGVDAPTFHGDAQRSGWHSRQGVLTPDNVGGSSFGLLWESPQLDPVDGQPPRLYASPVYAERVKIGAGPHQGETFSTIFAASNNGYAYAINAAKAGDVAPGRILWRTQLGKPCRLQPAPLDAVPTGVLSTPVIDVARGRLYLTSCDPEKKWQAYALDIGSGKVLPGWPVQLDEARFNAVNRNAGPVPVAPTRRFDFRVQRGALNLSPNGSRLYVTFGETETGWLVSVDTRKARVDSAFAAVAMPHRGSGGIWGAGGPAIDKSGNVYVVTGSGFDGFVAQDHDWTQSVLKLSDAASTGLKLEGTYTPFNYCGTAKMDIDLGSSGASLLPDLDAGSTSTPHLMVVGGKQGNAYLLDRDRLPGRLDRRQACSNDAASDGSLLPPQRQPQFAGRGPLSVFGPYSENDAALDLARARSTPASFRAADGSGYVFMTGNNKDGEGSPTSIPPSLVRLKVATASGKPAYLQRDAAEKSVVFGNPGSPVVSSHGSRDAIVWVLDENARRSAPLAGKDAPAPVLYAFDAMTLKLLWRSAPGQLHTSGKYNEPTFARGAVVVGTDRIQAFGLGAAPLPHRTGKTAEIAADRIAVAVAADSGLDGETIYQQRCSACHDHPQGNIPPRELIARRSYSHIVDTLANGAMRPQAAGLGPGDIEAVARYLKK
ncbi:hypothetical protein CSC74_15350 [Pseudoxanthomonas yeongjuensis]|nr:hypothetical protein CSC74_15350 [Pseudoxanthomonas yeongjuensis]